MPVSIGKGGRASDDDKLLELLQRVMGGLGKVAAVVMAAALIYVLWGVLRGHLAQDLSPQLERNFRGAATVFGIAAVALTLAVFIRYFAEAVFIWVMAALGALCFFVMPIIINSRAANDSSAARGMVGAMLGAGELIFFLVAARVVYELYQRARRGKVDPAEQEQTVIAPAKKAKMPSLSILQPCWELPYCHEHIKQVCPAWKKRRSCWRDKRGCNCDPTMIEAMLRSGAATRGVGAQQKQTASGYLRVELEDHADPADPQQQAFQQTISCSKCPIYNEHQRQKFRVLNPLMVVGCVAGLVAAYVQGYFERAFGWLITTASHMIAQLSFEGGQASSQPAWLAQLNTSGVYWLFIVLVSVMIFTYVVKVVEWAIFVKKI